MPATLEAELIDCGTLNIFREHATHTKNGKPLNFTWRELEKIIRNCNARVAGGDPAPIVIGHTTDDPDGPQRECVGFAKNYALGRLENGAYVIRCSLFLYPEAREVLKRFPYTSVELWVVDDASQMFFHPISLLSEAPRLDLGNVKFRMPGEARERYSRPERFSNLMKGLTMSLSPQDMEEVLAAVKATEEFVFVRTLMHAQGFGRNQEERPAEGESPYRETFRKPRELALKNSKRKAMRGEPVDYGAELDKAMAEVGLR